MAVDVGNKVTGVTEDEAAKGRRDLTEYLSQWWERAKQSPTSTTEKLPITWGALNCELELSLDQTKQPQLTLTGSQSAPRSVKETINRFLTDTCKVANVDEHFHYQNLQEKVLKSIGNDFDADVGALTRFGMFRPAPKASEAPKPVVSPKGPGKSSDGG